MNIMENEQNESFSLSYTKIWLSLDSMQLSLKSYILMEIYQYSHNVIENNYICEYIMKTSIESNDTSNQKEK